MLACPHQNTALRWNQKVQKFQCPKHHSQYKPDGTFIDGRATRSMDRFAVKHDGANLVVNLDKVYEDDRDHAGWLSGGRLTPKGFLKSVGAATVSDPLSSARSASDFSRAS